MQWYVNDIHGKLHNYVIVCQLHSLSHYIIIHIVLLRILTLHRPQRDYTYLLPMPTNVGAVIIRLAGGSTGFEGRVERYYAGSWGTVCDTGWDLNNAKVVCRQLGLGGAVRATTGTFFGRGTGGTILSSVDCTGSETALGWCLHSGWNSRSCSQAAGVVCEGMVWQLSISTGLSF